MTRLKSAFYRVWKSQSDEGNWKLFWFLGVVRPRDADVLSYDLTLRQNDEMSILNNVWELMKLNTVIHDVLSHMAGRVSMPYSIGN